MTKEDIDVAINKSIEFFKASASKMNTLRAQPSLVEDIAVDVYGAIKQPIKSLGNVLALDSLSIRISLWDKKTGIAVEKALLTSNISMSVTIEANGDILIKLPPASGERRQELCKEVERRSEAAKVSIRNIRRKYVDEARKKEKVSEISKDDLKHIISEIDQDTEKGIAVIDDFTRQKEREIMS